MGKTTLMRAINNEKVDGFPPKDQVGVCVKGEGKGEAGRHAYACGCGCWVGYAGKGRKASGVWEVEWPLRGLQEGTADSVLVARRGVCWGSGCDWVVTCEDAHPLPTHPYLLAGVHRVPLF